MAAIVHAACTGKGAIAASWFAAGTPDQYHRLTFWRCSISTVVGLIVSQDSSGGKSAKKGFGRVNVAFAVCTGMQKVDFTNADGLAIDLCDNFFVRNPDSWNLNEKSHETGREKVMKRVFHEERSKS